jgi:uncharacterized protein (DUF1684 family)
VVLEAAKGYMTVQRGAVLSQRDMEGHVDNKADRCMLKFDDMRTPVRQKNGRAQFNDDNNYRIKNDSKG